MDSDMTVDCWNYLMDATDLPSLRGLFNNLSPLTVLSIAEKAFREVIAANFVGCIASSRLPTFLSYELAFAELKFDLNEPFPGVRLLPLLLLAKVAIVDQRELDEFPVKWKLLAFRVLLLWQKILPEPSLTLKERMDVYAESVEIEKLSVEEKLQYFVERANSYLIYYEYDKSAVFLEYALECSNLSVDFVGKLGKRTRFQERDIAQLVLNMSSAGSSVANEDLDVPENCPLNNDILLEQVSLSENGDRINTLSSIQLAIVFAIFRLERRSEHCDELFMEKADAYLEAIIRQRRCWSVQAGALLSRCELERTRKRRVERACAQSELICNLMDGEGEKVPFNTKWKRCDLVLASGLDPFWIARCIHAETLQSLGCTSEALRLYEKLEMWDRVVNCFKKLGQLEKAEALIRRLISDRPNDSMLVCFLGDITMEVSYYNKAIEMSSDRNARARKSLGNLMLLRNHFESAYGHLRRSLELQPIQLGVWFNAGYCAWKMEHYSDAVACFHRCVSLEPDHFEAWNNLSSAYIKIGQKERARKILQEALKFNIEHPKVWENFLLLCVDTAHFDQAINAFHRLLDLNKQQKDDEVLDILASKVLQMYNEADDEASREQAAQLKGKLLKLFGRLSALQTLSSKAWQSYASLKRPSDDNVEEGEKYIQLLERSVLAASHKPNWSKDFESCCSVLSNAIELAGERLRFASLKGEDAFKQAKSRVRMSLKPLVAVVRKEYENVSNECVNESTVKVVECLTKADAILSEVSC